MKDAFIYKEGTMIMQIVVLCEGGGGGGGTGPARKKKRKKKVDNSEKPHYSQLVRM